MWLISVNVAHGSQLLLYFDNKSQRTHHISTQKPFFPSFVVKNNNIRQLPLIQNIYYFKMNEQRQAKKTQQNLFLFQETILFFKKIIYDSNS